VTAQLLRAGIFRRLWKREFLAQRAVTSSIQQALVSWGLIRSAKREATETLNVEARLREAEAASFELDFERTLTAWGCTVVLQILTYVLWCVSPILCARYKPFMLPSDFLVLLDLVGFLAGRVNGLQISLVELYTSSTMIQELARLFNTETTDETLVLTQAAAEGTLPKSASMPSSKSTRTEPVDVTAADMGKHMRGMRQEADVLAGRISDAYENVHADSARGGGLTVRELAQIENARAVVSAALSESKHAIRIERASFAQLGKPPVFEGLTLYDRFTADSPTGTPTGVIGAGGIIGVRVSGGGSFGSVADVTLLKLLGGVYTPQLGTATALLRAEIVTPQTAPLPSTLLGNLLYGVVPDEAMHEGLLVEPLPPGCEVPSDESLWRLCRRAGVSAALIGEEYAAGWSGVHLLNAEVWVAASDLVKLRVIRALLHQPEVLLLSRVGSQWALKEQRQLHAMLEEYMANGCSLEALAGVEPVSKGGAAGSRRSFTLVWCAADPVLAAALHEGRDRILTLESASRATIKPPSAVFPPALVRDAKDAWERGSMTDRWEAVPAPTVTPFAAEKGGDVPMSAADAASSLKAMLSAAKQGRFADSNELALLCNELRAALEGTSAL